MARLLHGEALWAEIRRLARRSQRLIAAVGFVGKNPEELLHWPRRSVLIADLSEGRVREGTSSARGALRLLRKGVQVWSLEGLHAKVFLFDRHAVVGSMNLSEDSRYRLEEAAVVLSGAELRGVREYLRHLQRKAELTPEDVLRELAKREPGRPRFALPQAREVPTGRGTRRRASEGRRARAAEEQVAVAGEKAFLFTWNPDGHPYIPDDEWRGLAAIGGQTLQWSCGVRRDKSKIPEGSLGFIVRVGRGVRGRGIVAFGRTTGAPYFDKDWRNSRRKTLCVDLEAEMTPEPERPIVTLEELRKRWPDVNWTPRASATAIPERVARTVWNFCEKRWRVGFARPG